MKTPSSRTCFLVATGLAFGLPLLGWFGLVGFVGAHGFDTPDVKPVFSFSNLFSGRFAHDVAAHFDHIFFGRTEMLILKNGLYDIANAGAYHSGFSGRIVQGRNGWLFEKNCLEVSFQKGFPIESRGIRRRTRSALKGFRDVLPKRRDGTSIPFAFVLAPNKAEFMRDKVPVRYKFFNQRPLSDGHTIPEPYSSFHAILSKVGVPFVDAFDQVGPKTDPRAIFPYGGTHWTVDLAARSVSAALALVSPDLPRPVPLDPVFAPNPDDLNDRDIANLLNLPIPYRYGKDMHAHARFPEQPHKTDSGHRIALIGDSYCEQARAALLRSGLYDEDSVVMWSNEMPPAADFRDFVSKGDAILFIYSAPSLAKSRVASMLKALSNDLSPSLQSGAQYALGRSPYTMEGEWKEENGGRILSLAPGSTGWLYLPWKGQRARLHLVPVPEVGENLSCSVSYEEGTLLAASLPAGCSTPLVFPLPDGPGPYRIAIRADSANAAPLRLTHFSVVSE